jgi:hypothetical protein
VKLPNSDHEAHPWVIAQVAPDFQLLDVWAPPARGRRDEFDAFLEMIVSFDPATAESAATRALFWLRLRLGAWFGWDNATKRRPIPGCPESTLSARLSDDLRQSAQRFPVVSGPQRHAAGFSPLYRTDQEAAAEISNATVHGVLHVAWVEQGDGLYRGRIAVYVKRRGRLGKVYLTLIEPFRHLVVYPALMRQFGRAWDARRAGPGATINRQ